MDLMEKIEVESLIIVIIYCNWSGTIISQIAGEMKNSLCNTLIWRLQLSLSAIFIGLYSYIL